MKIKCNQRKALRLADIALKLAKDIEGGKVALGAGSLVCHGKRHCALGELFFRAGVSNKKMKTSHRYPTLVRELIEAERLTGDIEDAIVDVCKTNDNIINEADHKAMPDIGTTADIAAAMRSLGETILRAST